jgi:carotenoid cleavage dioxygenase-like enzyme
MPPPSAAHPKIDPKTGNMCNFSYMADGPLTLGMRYFEIAPNGELLFEVRFDNKYLCMMHDFGVTEDYAVFNVMPLITGLDRLEKRMPYFGYDGSLPTWLGYCRGGRERPPRTCAGSRRRKPCSPAT